MGRDLFLQPYGRFYYIARQLAEMGHEVELYLFSYRNEGQDQQTDKRLQIYSVSLLPNPIATCRQVYSRIKLFNPDWVIGFSDTYYGIFAEYMASRLQAKSLIDAYDNYEAYIPFALPLHWFWRRALKKADLVSCAGPGLKKLFEQYRRTKTTIILPMTADPVFHCKLSKAECRQKLGLPSDQILVGYHGSIHQTRDIHCLFSAAKRLTEQQSDISFLLTGRVQQGLQIPEYCRYLGYLPSADVPVFLNSLDVLVVTNKRSAFGNHSYPVKLYEAMCSEIPVIASRTPATEWILSDYSECLVEPESPDELVEKIKLMSKLDGKKYQKLPDWQAITCNLEQAMLAQA